jgi:hypothetical protein
LYTKKEKLQIFEILGDFALNETEPDLSAVKPSAATVFKMARPVLERAHERAKMMATVNNMSSIP